MSKLPFDGNMSESIKVFDLKKDHIYLYVSFVLHASIIEKGWIDATFLQELRHNRAVIQGDTIKCLAVQQLPMFRCKYASKSDIQSRGVHNFIELF